MKNNISIILLSTLFFHFSIVDLVSNDSLLLDFYYKSKQLKSDLRDIKMIKKETYLFPSYELISTDINFYNNNGFIVSELIYSSGYHSLKYYYYEKINNKFMVRINLIQYFDVMRNYNYMDYSEKRYENLVTFDENMLTSNGNIITEITKEDNTFEVKHYEKCYLFLKCLIVEEKYDSLYRPIYKNFINSKMIYKYKYEGDSSYMDIEFERSPLRNLDQLYVNTKTVRSTKERRVYEEEIFYPDVYNLKEISLLNSLGQDSIIYELLENDQGVLDTITVQKYRYEFYSYDD